MVVKKYLLKKKTSLKQTSRDSFIWAMQALSVAYIALLLLLSRDTRLYSTSAKYIKSVSLKPLYYEIIDVCFFDRLIALLEFLLLNPELFNNLRYHVTAITLQNKNRKSQASLDTTKL